MNNLNDKEIYVVFDANSGKVVSIHVVGLSTRIPTEAIRVTGEQYARLIEDSNWVYDWDTEKLVYKPVDKSLNLEELREACRNKINAAVSATVSRLAKAFVSFIGTALCPTFSRLSRAPWRFPGRQELPPRCFAVPWVLLEICSPSPRSILKRPLSLPIPW